MPRTPAATRTSTVPAAPAWHAGAVPEADTPMLHLDTDLVRERYVELGAALPGVRLHYAVKANPAHPVLQPAGGARRRLGRRQPGRDGARPARRRAARGHVLRQHRQAGAGHRLGLPARRASLHPRLPRRARQADAARPRRDADGAVDDLGRRRGLGPRRRQVRLLGAGGRRAAGRRRERRAPGGRGVPRRQPAARPRRLARAAGRDGTAAGRPPGARRRPERGEPRRGLPRGPARGRPRARDVRRRDRSRRWGTWPRPGR